jgi:MFS family permease
MAGLVEGSMLLGYILTFLSGLGSFLMRRYNSRILLAGNSGITALLTLATGVVFLDHRNLTVVVVSIALRVLQGCCSYLSYVFLFDTFSAQFSTYFDLAVALNGLAGYAGMGLSVTIGCVLYDKLGYVTTFAVASATCMVLGLLMLFLPPTPTYLSGQKQERQEPEEELCVKRVNKLSWLTVVPLVASLFINLNFGYLQVCTSSDSDLLSPMRFSD